MTIKVTPEGRDGIWVPDKESLKAWIRAKNFDGIHNFISAPGLLIGADHDADDVLVYIDNAERLAITTGDAWRENMRHALAVIINNELGLYDLGEITEADLEVAK